MSTKQITALSSFVCRECANYDHHYGGCLFDNFGGKCAVVDLRQPCRYFERSVLGPPDYPYKTAGYDWQKLFAAYGEINPAFAGRGVSVRRCPDCGAVLSARQRYCSDCSRKRAKEANRARQREHRKNRGSNVTV